MNANFRQPKPLQLLFIHHSCGGQLLADFGDDRGANGIYLTHPNGGGLRTRLEQKSYAVHEASYGSRIGGDTDVFDWLPKFQNDMEKILTCDSQDARHADGGRNHIVVFKSCFPNNEFKAEGQAPGNAADPKLTVWNARATYTALLDEFQKYPEVLFISMTPPPVAPKAAHASLWKRIAKKMLGRHDCRFGSARLAREFNNWLSRQSGWLKDRQPTNVAVFDYYDILTDHGASNLSRYPTGDGFDSHPSREGNQKAAEAFLPFLDWAAKRAGLSGELRQLKTQKVKSNV